MAPTAREIERTLGQHDNNIPEIYAKFTYIERKVDSLRAHAGSRFDQVESRPGTLVGTIDSRFDAVESALVAIGLTLTELDHDLSGLDLHVGDLDQHLCGIETDVVELLRRDPAS